MVFKKHFEKGEGFFARRPLLSLLAILRGKIRVGSDVVGVVNDFLSQVQCGVIIVVRN